MTANYRAYSTVTDYTFNVTLTSTTINSITVQSSFTDPINLNVFILAPLSWWVPLRPNGFVQTQQFVVRVAVSGLTF